MNLFFITWGAYSGLESAIKCANARCGCPVHVVRDPKSEILKKLLPEDNYDGGKVARATSLARWFVLRDEMEARKLEYPVFCSDWDVMTFSNLEPACAPFLANDFARTVNHPNLGDVSAAYLVCRKEPLDEFCRLVEASTESVSNQEYHDMAVWRQVGEQGKWKIGDLTDIVNGGTFDHNVHCSLGKYRMNGESKLVTFRDGHPYFTLDSTSEEILAHNIHCWGEYKGREPELLKLAGIV